MTRSGGVGVGLVEIWLSRCCSTVARSGQRWRLSGSGVWPL
jgi:hypothetical protein